MSEKIYDEPSPLDMLDALIDRVEQELPYSSTGGQDDRLGYMVVANLRAARVGLALTYGRPDEGAQPGTPRWNT